MVNEREIISPSSLLYHYHHHHHAFIFSSSFFSLIPINFPNSLLTLIPFPNTHSPSPFPSLIVSSLLFFSLSFVLSPRFPSGCLSFRFCVCGSGDLFVVLLFLLQGLIF